MAAGVPPQADERGGAGVRGGRDEGGHGGRDPTNAASDDHVRLTPRSPLGEPNVVMEHENEDPFEGVCPVRWLVDDVGRYLVGDEAEPAEVGSAGRQALTRAATEVNDLLHSAYSATEVVATELRFAGPQRGFRRTVFALSPRPWR